MRLLRRKQNAAPAGTMPLIDHLVELRRRLLISFGAIVFGAIFVFIFYNTVLNFLSAPYERATQGSPGCGPNGCKLVVIDPLSPLLVRLKISGYGGLALAVPFVMYQIWAFIVPGLHQRERRYAVGFVVGSVLLFVLGGFVAWLTIDRALEFLLGIGGPELRPLIDANKYVTLVMLMIAAFGVAFEFPLLLVFLLLVGAVTTAQLRRFRRWAAVGITVFSAIITPSQDPFSLLFMAVPLYVFYEASILIGRLMKR